MNISHPNRTFQPPLLHKKWSFLLSISSVNVTKSAVLRIWSHLLKKSLVEIFIFCAVRIAQNWGFVMNPAYHGGDTIVSEGGKILDFRLSEIPQNEPFRTFYSPKLSLENWILECQYFGIAIQISIIVYSSPSFLPWLKNANYIYSQTCSWSFFWLCQNNWLAESNAHTLIRY